MDVLKYKDYIGSIEFSIEDNCFFGQVLGLDKSGVTYLGNTVEELREDFEGAVDDYLALCKDRNCEPEKPNFGKLVLNMPEDLHLKAFRIATHNGESMNAFINRAVRRETERVL